MWSKLSIEPAINDIDTRCLYICVGIEHGCILATIEKQRDGQSDVGCARKKK